MCNNIINIMFYFRFVIDVGFLDKIFEVQLLDLELLVNIGEIVCGILIVIGYELGLKFICLDFVVNLK